MRCHPFVPPIEVREGDLLRLTVVNRSGETHPMHPHGHRVLVLRATARRAPGSPLWLDTFDVQPGEVWTVRCAPTTRGSGWRTATTLSTRRKG